jgi:hypothetical protein
MSNNLKLLVNSFSDIQLQRVVLSNRIKLKKDGTGQKVNDGKTLRVEDYSFLRVLLDEISLQEERLKKEINKELKTYKIYNEFLINVKGIGDTLAGILLANFDIYKADTVSKFYAFAGICKGLVRGIKWIGKAGNKKPVRTDILVQRDRLTEGFSSPFNKDLRSKLLGVLAASFLKSNSPYRLFYDNYKNRKEQEFKGNKDYSKLRIHRMANRYMIKMFLSDFWTKWREIENLPIRIPYAEEYLGKVHSENKEIGYLVIKKKSNK